MDSGLNWLFHCLLGAEGEINNDKKPTQHNTQHNNANKLDTVCVLQSSKTLLLTVIENTLLLCYI